MVEQLFTENEERLFRFFRKKTGNSQEAEDLIQDLYVSALENLNSIARVENQAAWLFKVATNKLNDWFRRKSRKDSLSLENSSGDFDLLNIIEDTSIDLEDDFCRELLLEELDQAIQELPDELRDIIMAQSLDGQSFKEIAEQKDIPIGTLLSRKRAAIEQLRIRLRHFEETWLEMT